MDKSLSYDDVLLVPKYSDIRSRSEIDITGDLTNGLSLPLPIISSPMDTITETTMSFIMACMGGSGIIHRYNTIEEQSKMVREASAEIDSVAIGSLGAAVGVTGDYIERAQSLVFAGVKYICVDIAHGHHILMKEALYNLRKALPPNFHIMAGNVATLQGVNDLADWGANSVRCNIGGGSICSTRIQTGHGMPGLQTIFDCAKTDRDVGIIADGGIRNAGDIVKALAAGADAVMCGSLLDASGSYKVYRGMASKEAQINWRGRYSSFEGISSVVPCRGNVDSLLDDLGKNIKSGFSYSGARNMKELRLKADFTQQTTAGTVESGTHISSKAV